MIIKPNLFAQIFYYFGSYILRIEERQLIRELKTLWFIKRKPKVLNCDKIIVFDTKLNLFGFKVSTGYKAGGQDDKTLNICGLSKQQVNQIKAYIQESGAKISSLEGSVFTTLFPWFSPSRWLSYREKIILNDEGVGHIRKSWFKTRESFLPYPSIKMYCYNGLLAKDILILGDTTISLFEKISNHDNGILKRKLEEKGITSTEGRKYLPALLSLKRSLINPDVLITTPNGVLFKSKKLIGEQTNIYLDYDDIIKFKKIGWYKLFAPVIIEARRVDARKGEGGNVSIYIEGVAFYRWCTLLFFDGSLKSSLKSKCK